MTRKQFFTGGVWYPGKPPSSNLHESTFPYLNFGEQIPSYCFIKGKICAPFSFSTIEFVSQTVLFFFPWSVVCTFCHNQQLRISKYVLQPFLHSQNTFERHFFVKRECMRALYDSFFSFCCNFLLIGNTNLKVRLWWMNLGSGEFKVRHVKFEAIQNLMLYLGSIQH